MFLKMTSVQTLRIPTHGPIMRHATSIPKSSSSSQKGLWQFTNGISKQYWCAKRHGPCHTTIFSLVLGAWEVWTWRWFMLRAWLSHLSDISCSKRHPSSSSRVIRSYRAPGGSIGNAVGFTISSAIWQGVLPKKLAIYLPADQQANLTMIYSDIVTQLSFPVGSDTRLAIQHAYGDTQRYLFITGTASWVLGLVAVLMWRNINTIGIKQTKGRVF